MTRAIRVKFQAELDSKKLFTGRSALTVYVCRMGAPGGGGGPLGG